MSKVQFGCSRFGDIFQWGYIQKKVGPWMACVQEIIMLTLFDTKTSNRF